MNIPSELSRITRLMETDLFAAGDQAAALAERYPDDFDALMLRGYIRMRLRDHKGAIASLVEVLKLDPDSQVVNFNLGVCHDKLGELETALRYFCKAKDVEPRENSLPAVLAARCLHRLGRVDEGIAIYEEVLRRSPAHDGARLWLMQALREKSAFTEADKHAAVLLRHLSRDAQSQWMLVEHIQQNDFYGWMQVDDKASLKAQVDVFRRTAGGGSFAIMPQTFVMPDEFDALAEAHETSPGIWIVKPRNLHNGYGIYLISAPDEAPREPGWVVQRYVDNPYLIEQRKMNLRVFLLITSVSPPRVYLFQGGHTIFSVEPYEHGSQNLDNLPMHVAHSNVFGDAVAAQYEETKKIMGHEFAEWTYDRLADYMRDQGVDTDALWSRLETVATEVVKLFVTNGLFEQQAAKGCRFAYIPKIIGLDILIDQTGRPWLMEIESGPTLNGMFDGGVKHNDVFATVAAMTILPLLEGAGAADALADRDAYAARESELENGKRKRFTRIWPVQSDQVGR